MTRPASRWPWKPLGLAKGHLEELHELAVAKPTGV